VNFDGLAARKLREGGFASEENAIIRPSATFSQEGEVP